MATDWLLSRPDDLAVLGARLDGFDISSGFATAGAGGGTIALALPPQHVMEEVVLDTLAGPGRRRAETGGPSVLTFAVGAGRQVALTAEGVLSACRGDLVASDVELPARLRFAISEATTAVASRPVAVRGVAGPWRTRFRRTGEAPMRATALDRALAGSPDPDFAIPLIASVRLQIADHSATDPAVVRRLELTSLGGSTEIEGTWEGFSWSERVTGGRDHQVQVAQRVRLYPFGFEGVLSTVTTRDQPLDGAVIEPGHPAQLVVTHTLRITKSVVGSDDGRAMGRTFPFRAVELLPAVLGFLGTPEVFFTHTRITSDAQGYLDQINAARAEQAQQATVWGPYVNGLNRDLADLRRLGFQVAIDFDTASADRATWQAEHETNVANRAASDQFSDQAADARARGDRERELNPDDPNAGADWYAQAVDLDAQARQYAVSFDVWQRTEANLAAANARCDQLWPVVQSLMVPRTVGDAAALGDLNPEVSAAATRWLELEGQANDLRTKLDELTDLARPLDVAAFPRNSDGQRVRFPIRLHPLASAGTAEVIDVEMPLVLVYDVQLDPVPAWDLPAYRSLDDPDLAGALDEAWAGPPEAPLLADAAFEAAPRPPSAVDVRGAVLDVVGAAVPKPSDRQTVAVLNIVGHHGADPFVPSLGRLADAAGATGVLALARPAMAVHLPALQRLAGDAVPGVDSRAVVGFAQQFVEHGEAADVLLRTFGDGIKADFTTAADRTGGMLGLDVVSDAISRERGPAQLAALLGTDPDPAALIGEAATLLGFKLQDLVAHLPGLKPPTIVTDAVTEAVTGLAAGADPADLAARSLAQSVPPVTVEWKNVRLTDFLAFKATGSGAHPTELNLTVKAGPTGTTTDCRVNEFALQFPFADDDALIRLSFAGLHFQQQTIVKVTGAATPETTVLPPKVDVDWSGLEFKGQLALLAKLQEMVKVVGSVATIDSGPHGVVATTNLPVPDVRCGAFALSNLDFHSRVDIPFDGAPVGVEIGFASRAKPFSLSVLAFAGGGWITVAIDAAGPRVDAALEFGAQIGVDFVVASGEVHAFGGVSYVQQGDDVSLSGYLRLGGSLEVLHLVTVRVELRLALAYDGHALVGRASIVLELDLTLWSGSVEIDSGPWVIAGSEPVGAVAESLQGARGLDTVEDALAAIDAEVTDEELAAWQAFRSAVPTT